VSAVIVNPVAPGGQIKVTYTGPQVNAKLSGLILSLSPGLDTNYDVIWVCGNAPVPGTVTTVGPASVTNIPAAYLPTSCHA